MLRIVPFAAAHASGVIELVLSIQQDEFALPITLADQPDLLDPQRHFRQGNGNFWVALDGQRVVGTVALLDMGQRRAALRKMFVHPAHRGPGSGLAARLLATAVDWCASHSIGEIWLGTTEQFVAAHRFYEKHGFERIDAGNLPAGFPRMAVDTRFYRRSLVTHLAMPQSGA